MRWQLLFATRNFEMRGNWVSQIVLLGVLTNILVVSCTGFLPHPRQKELHAAYERSVEVLAEARLNSDTSHLSEVFTQNVIPEIIEGLEKKKDPTFRAEEIEVDWIKVIEYEPPVAVIEVKYFYRGYTYDRETGKKTYDDPRPHRYWRIWKEKMIQEDGIWKVDESLEFVDWSG